MPPPKTLRQSSLRRRQKRRSSSKRGRRSYRATSPRRTGGGVPLAFQEFNRVRADAEYRGLDAFTWNGNTYQRHEWSSGIPVWKRA